VNYHTTTDGEEKLVSLWIGDHFINSFADDDELSEYVDHEMRRALDTNPEIELHPHTLNDVTPEGKALTFDGWKPYDDLCVFRDYLVTEWYKLENKRILLDKMEDIPDSRYFETPRYVHRDGHRGDGIHDYNATPKFEQDIKYFYSSKAWKAARAIVHEAQDKCQACDSKHKLHVDHIKPLRYFWTKRLDISNLQLLCKDCNMEKGSSTDWVLHEARMEKLNAPPMEIKNRYADSKCDTFRSIGEKIAKHEVESRGKSAVYVDKK
jgi:hypothetical protein